MPFERLENIYGSLRFRLTLWNTAVMLLTAVVALLLLREGMRVTLLRDTDQRLLEDADELALAIQQFYPNMREIREEMNRKALGHRGHGLFLRLLDLDGNTVYHTSNTPNLELPPLPTDVTDTLLMTSGDFRLARRYVEVEGETRYRIRIGTSMRLLEEDISRLTGLIVLVGGVILVLSPMGGYWLAGRATQPLQEMLHAAAKLRPAQLHERLPMRGSGDELDRLAETINGLLDRIAAYIDRHKQFIANAAHELRSPLAAVQSSVEVTLAAERAPEEYQEVLAEVVEECGALRILVNQLLLLAESDAGGQQAVSEVVPLADVAVKCVEMFRGVAEESHLELRSGRLEPVEVRGHAGRLRQVVNNLIDNAIKFTAARGEVVVEVVRDATSETARLTVRDTGPGIAADDLPRIFERFYRGDKSRPREGAAHGSGLGLSICQAIVEAHGGTITAENADRGAIFTVALPLVSGSVDRDTPAPRAESPRPEREEYAEKS